MSHSIPCHTLPTPIALGSPLYRRLVKGFGEAFARFDAWRRDRAEQRAAQRQAALHQALVEQLDAGTLRDIGLGDWVAARGAGRSWDGSHIEPRRF